MFNKAYIRQGDNVSHHTTVEAAPPGEAIRHADAIRKELEARADRIVRQRIAFEFECPDLGKIKFVVIEQMNHREMRHDVLYQLNGRTARMEFDHLKYNTPEDLLRGLFKQLSEDMAREMLTEFLRANSSTRLFGTLKGSR